MIIVIFTTNSLSGSRSMTNVHPRYVIMDESGATPEYETFVIASRNPGTLLLVGDFLQLPPVIKSQKVKDRLGMSVMERLWHYTVAPRRQLVYQYRFDPKFESFLNTFIYNEQSRMSPIHVATDPNRPHKVLRPGLSVTMPVIVIDSSSATKGGGESHELHNGYENVCEAQLVVDVVRRLIESSRIPNSIEPASIGICAPYKRQVSLIKHMLQRMVKPGGFKYNLVTVATADAFQGSERDYMIVSTVRTSTKCVEFALSQKRLNVMLTRGRVLTVVVSNKAMFESDDINSLIYRAKVSQDVSQGGKAFRGLFEWATDNNAVYDISNWATIFQTNSTLPDSVGSVGVLHAINWIGLDNSSTGGVANGCLRYAAVV